MSHLQEAIPYGYYVNFIDLVIDVHRRRLVGETTLGEGILYQGATLEQSPSGTRLNIDNNNGMLPIEVRVDVRGRIRMSFNPEDLERFHAATPRNWASSENP